MLGETDSLNLSLHPHRLLERRGLLGHLHNAHVVALRDRYAVTELAR